MKDSFSTAVKTEKEEGIEFNSIEYLGLIAGSFAVVAGIAQIVTLFQRQSADDISYIFLVGACISTGLWVMYHFLKRGGGPLITTSLTFVGLLIVLALKVVFDVGGQDSDVNEIRTKEKKGYYYELAHKISEADDDKEDEEERKRGKDADLTIISSQG